MGTLKNSLADRVLVSRLSYIQIPIHTGPDSLVVKASASGVGGSKVRFPVSAAVGFVLIWPVGEPPAKGMVTNF